MPGISGIRPEQICMHVEVQFKKERTCNRGDCNRSGVFPRKIEIFAYLVSVQKIFGILSGFYMVWSVLHHITFPLQMLTINVKHVKNLCYGMPEELLKI